MKVTLVQTKLYWEQPAANLKMLTEKLATVNDTSLIVLPETFTTGFSMKSVHLADEMDGPTVNWMQQISFEKKCAITGSAMIREEGKVYNRLLWVNENEVQHYDKKHLFSISPEGEWIAPGNKRLIVELDGRKFCCMICYDLRFPVWCRNDKSNPFDVLVFVANWPQRRALAWSSLLQARAIENQCFVVAANRVGEDGTGVQHIGSSCIIDPLGQVLYRMENEEDIHTAALDFSMLDKVRSELPFLNDADDFQLTR